MAGVGGSLSFDDAVPAEFDWPLDTPFVPLLDDTSQSSPHRQLAWPAYGVPLRRVMTRRLGAPGQALLPQPRWEDRGARDVLGLNDNQAAVLMGYGTDELIERVWERRYTDKLIERIANMGFDLVTSPDYSVNADHPRAEHLFNLRRSMVFTQELVDAGVNAIPSVYWFRREDLDRWISWIEDHNPVAICRPAHTLRHKSDWEQLGVRGMAYLGAALNQLGVRTRVLITGVSNRDRISQLASWFGPRLTITSQQPSHLAAQGRRPTDKGREVFQAHRSDLFAYNVKFYERRIVTSIADATSKEPA